MSVIPGTISFDDMKPKEAPKVAKKRVTNEVPKKGSDFFVHGEDKMQELEAMEYEIGGFVDTPQSTPSPAPAPAPAPVEQAKPPKKKRQLSEKQLAHLAKMRANKAAKRAAKQPAAPAPAPKPQKTDDEKAAKRARKRQEMKDYFNELYGEKEKVRMAAKDKRRAEKQAMYQKLIASGQLSINRPAAPAPAPAPAPVVPLGKKRVRWDGLELVTYYE